MLRALVHAGAWTAATGAAATLSWFGVHHALAGTAYDAPRALAISDVGASPSASPSASVRASVSATASRRSSSPSSPLPRSSSASPSASVVHTTASPTAAGNIRSYAVDGGRVVLDVGTTYATFVSATPDGGGWQMQVWNQDGWIRVDFTAPSGKSTSTVFCTWNGHPPTVQTYVTT